MKSDLDKNLGLNIGNIRVDRILGTKIGFIGSHQDKISKKLSSIISKIKNSQVLDRRDIRYIDKAYTRQIKKVSSVEQTESHGG